jgi:hypothetical protein
LRKSAADLVANQAPQKFWFHRVVLRGTTLAANLFTDKLSGRFVPFYYKLLPGAVKHFLQKFPTIFRFAVNTFAAASFGFFDLFRQGHHVIASFNSL